MRPTFAELSLALKLAALYAAHGLDALELLAARNNTQLFRRTLEDVKRQADLLAEAHRLLSALAPHEDAVRRLLDQPVRRVPPPSEPFRRG